MELVNKAAETLAAEFDVDVGYKPIDGRDILIVSPREKTSLDRLVDDIDGFRVDDGKVTHANAYSNRPTYLAFEVLRE